ncbi:MAG: DUF934 domain-containing protein [Flavobacteriaceae bacterium]
MGVLVRDGGFAVIADEIFLAPEAIGEGAGHAVDLANDADPQALAGLLDRLSLIRIAFPSFADGRGFSLARRLRLAGYRGTLRARGHVLADQYPLAIRCGFDEVEITPEQAARQPERQWAESLRRVALNYQDRLMGQPSGQSSTRAA